MRRILSISLSLFLNLALNLTLVGCANPDAPTPVGTKPEIQSEFFEKDMTDITVCRGPTPIGLKIESTTWHQDLQAELQIVATLSLHAEPGQLTLQKTCHVGRNTFVAEVKSPLIFSRDSLHVVTAASNEVRLETETTIFSCKTDLKSGEIIEYKFRGPCLELKWREKTVVMIPDSL
jgi:hypothetical protein